MDHSRFQIETGLWLDARRALWIAEHELLAVADLHLGYAWAHREAGQMLPIETPDDTVERLLELQSSYRPKQLLLLGDIVHRAVPVPAIEADLSRLIRNACQLSALTLVAGNHDRHLDRVLNRCRLGASLLTTVRVGNFEFVHGENPGAAEASRSRRSGPERIRTVMGHEHPAISVGDGVATAAKCPCFLLSENLIVLPAFSRWASGTSVGSYPFMSELAQEADFRLAVAILGDRLLPVALD